MTLSEPETPRISSRRVEDQEKRDKMPRALRLVGYDDLERDSRDIRESFENENVQLGKSHEKYHYDGDESKCDRLLQRSCLYNPEFVLSFIYSKSLEVCDVACRSSTGCVGYTYHRQGGGGLETSSPCVLYSKCQVRDSVWCRDCVTVIIDGCHDHQEDEDVLDNKIVDGENDTVLLLGGFALDHVHHVEMLSASGLCSRQIQDMEVPRSRAVSGVVGDKVIVCGGRTQTSMYSSSCSVLDLTSSEGWVSEPETARLQQGREDAASAVLGEDMMVVTGGWDGERLLDSVEVNRGHGWQEVPGWRLTSARYQHCAVAMGQSLIIAGGYPTLRQVQILSLDHQDWRGWRDLTPMRGGRVAHGCAVTNVGGRHVLILAGGQNGGEFLTSVEALPLHQDDNIDSDWFALPDLLQPRRNHALSVMGGSLFVIGGDTAVYEPMVGFLYQLVSQIETLQMTVEDEEDDGGDIKWKVSPFKLRSPRTVMNHVVVHNKYCHEN